MSTYVLMRILESAPHRYDLGIRLLTFGRLESVYDDLASHVEPGQRVLDIGCGTGALTIRVARRGARVKGIDVNPEMLDIAKQKVRAAGLQSTVELEEMGAAELDAEETDSYDAVVSGLCFSELGPAELSYTLEQVARILRPGGLLLVADEVRPGTLPGRLLHAAIRAPLAALAWLVTGQATRPLAYLDERLTDAGFSIESATLRGSRSLGVFVARIPEEVSS